MSYPLYAYREVFVPAVSGATIELAPAGITTDQLTAGQIGLFTYSHGIIGSSFNSSTTSSAIVAVGSYHTLDAFSPTWGGLLESDKSKPIAWKNVKRYWRKTAVAPLSMVISVGWDQTLTGPTSQVGPTFQCGTFYRLLLEAKGESALRTLAHEEFRDVEAWTGCCGGNCQSGCTGQLVDATTVMLQWSDFIKQDPILSIFFVPQVYINGTYSAGYTYNTGAKLRVYSAYDVTLGLGGSQGAYVANATNPGVVVASLQITTGYTDTSFNNCTFTPSDYYQVEPLLIYASLRMDDGLEANPCQVTTTINTSVPNMVTTLQSPVQIQGTGESVVRDWITYRRYKTEWFPDGWEIDLYRMRQIEDDVCLANVSRTSLYDEIHILHQQEFSYNPSSIVDNPVYEKVFYLPTGTASSVFTTLITNCLTAASNPVTLEVF